jgi:hypothetical protein
MKILFIEHSISGTNPFGIETGIVPGDDPDAEGYEQTFRGYIDPHDNSQCSMLNTMKENAHAIYEVDNITAKNNQFRVK